MVVSYGDLLDPFEYEAGLVKQSQLFVQRPIVSGLFEDLAEEDHRPGELLHLACDEVQLLVHHQPVRLKELPDLRKEALEIVKVDDDLIREHGVEAIGVLEVTPVADVDLRLSAMLPDAPIGVLLLHGRKGQPHALHSISLDEVDEGPSPPAADVQDALAGLELHQPREQV